MKAQRLAFDLLKRHHNTGNVGDNLAIQTSKGVVLVEGIES